MTAILNTKVATPQNPFLTFCPAPSDIDIAIHNVPLFALPDKDTLNKDFPEVFCLASGVTPIATRFLNKDDTSRNAKAASSIVVTVSAADAPTIGQSINLYSKSRRCAVMWSASPTTQCQRCWKFGHSAKGCREFWETCPICAKDHSRNAHHCVIYTCPGFQKPTANCCAVSIAKCANCGGRHAADSKSCPTYLALPRKSKQPTPPHTQNGPPLAQNDTTMEGSSEPPSSMNKEIAN